MEERRFQTINYRFFGRKNKILTVFIPGLSGEFAHVQKILEKIATKTDVIYVGSGFVGLNKIESQSEDNYSFEPFVLKLHDLLSEFKYDRVIFLSGSLGTVPAMKYFSKFSSKKDLLFLDSPILYKQEFMRDLFLGKILFPLSKALPEGLLERITREVLKLFVAHADDELNVASVAGKIGMKSCILGFNEAFNFGMREKDLAEKIFADNRVTVLFGEKDGLLLGLCDMDTIRKAKDFRSFFCGHWVFGQKVDEVFEIVMQRAEE